MSIEEAILEAVRALPVDKQRQVLDFAGSLKARTLPEHPRRSLRGLCKDLGPAPSGEDIAEVRREMWGSFPRNGI